MTSTVSNVPGLRSIQASDAKAEIPLIYNPTTGDYDLATSSGGLLNVANYVWNTGTLSWDKEVQGSGGGGGGGAVTIADGADVAEGTTTDPAYSGSGAGTVISLLKKLATSGGGATSISDGADVAEGATTDAAVITDVAGTVSGKLRGLVKWAFERMPSSLGQQVMAASLPVVIASNQTSIPVDATGSTVGAVVTGSVAITNLPAVQPVNDNGGSLTVDGSVSVTNFPATQPVSGTVALDAGTLAALESITVQNGAGAASVNIQDGGNSITVDGPLTDTQLRATPVPVSLTSTTITGTVTVDQPVVDLVGNAPAAASVGIASATALAANASRKGAVFVNLSNNTISFGLDGNAAVLNNGISLTPFGTWVMDDYTFTTGVIAAIASAAASALSIQEMQ